MVGRGSDSAHRQAACWKFDEQYGRYIHVGT